MTKTLERLATLSAVRPGYGTSIQDVLAAPTPASTRTYSAVSYGAYLSAIADSIARQGLTIDQASYQLTKEGRNLFGTLTLANPIRRDWQMMVGFRTGNARDMSLWIAVGLSVFVCSNGSFMGEFLARTLHRGNAYTRLADMADNAVAKIIRGEARVAAWIDSWRTADIDDTTAKATIVEAAEAGAIPGSKILPVWKEYQEPTHEAFAPRTAWSLHNAFTEIQKTRSAQTTHSDTLRLHNLFAERFRMNANNN